MCACKLAPLIQLLPYSDPVRLRAMLCADGINARLEHGKAWGVCSSQPKLPSLKMNYDAEFLHRLRTLSAPQIFAEHEGCGSLPLIISGNRAGRYGGGVYQNGCDSGIRTRTPSGAETSGTCWVGGISDKTHASVLLVFENNEANGAGGAIFTKCYELGVCGSLTDKYTGVPAPGGEILSFRGQNRAGGYGNTIASAPHEIVLVQAKAPSAEAPAVTTPPSSSEEAEAAQVIRCRVTSGDLKSENIEACSSVGEKCVTATSPLKIVYACSSSAAVMFDFDCANTGGTVQYNGLDFTVICCDTALCNNPDSIAVDPPPASPDVSTTISESSPNEYIPGKTPFDLTFKLLDDRGEEVQGSSQVEISHSIQVCDCACVMFDCDTETVTAFH